ncbi:MAG: hypothetical protein JXM72_13100 [Deltaproteobacteria bacterium]|nr:hypothetical protein [Deltaproteobacteria bacterium]
MEIKDIAIKLVGVHKASFDNACDAMISIQDQAESMVNALLAQATLIPQENKDALGQLVKVYKKGRDDFKHVVDDGYAKVETYISSTLNI